MSRLYIKKQVDLSKTGNRASKLAEAAIYWGSVGDSKLAARISVDWPKGAEYPTITLRAGEVDSPIPRENIDFHGFIPVQDFK